VLMPSVLSNEAKLVVMDEQENAMKLVTNDDELQEVMIMRTLL